MNNDYNNDYYRDPGYAGDADYDAYQQYQDQQEQEMMQSYQDYQSYASQPYAQEQHSAPSGSAYSSQEKVSGNWNGEEVSFFKSFQGQDLTEEQVRALLNNEKPVLERVSAKNGKPYKVVTWLEKEISQRGNEFVKVKFDFVNDPAGMISGVWQGKQISIPRNFRGKDLTDEEAQALFECRPVILERISAKTGKPYKVSAHLQADTCAVQNPKIRIETDFVNDWNSQSVSKPADSTSKGPQSSGTSEKVSGVFKGKQIRFNRVFRGYRLTDEEVEKVLAGEEIVVSLVSKAGKPYKYRLWINPEHTYNGSVFPSLEGGFL